MYSGWERIWNKSKASEYISKNEHLTDEEIFTELKLYTNPNYEGETKPKGVYEQFVNQFKVNLREMSFSATCEFKPESFFDVGCATAPYLFYLQSCNPSYKLGGVDYSQPFIEVAKRFINNPIELYCAEAIELNTDVKYDCVYSRSIFQYFADCNYGKRVTEKMIEKSNYSVGIFDVHDLAKKEGFLSYRRSKIENYDENNKDTPHLFYPKSMFIEIAEKLNCDVKFAHCYLQGYWNAPFTYDVYFYKRQD